MASNYQVVPYILSGGPAAGPYLIPPSFPATSSQLVISVPNVGGSGASGGGCAIAAAGDNTDFSLAWAPSQNPPLFQVTVQPTHAFSDQPEDRKALYASFNAFLVQLETLELDTAAGCLVPGGADVIARVVAGSLPLRLDEVLAYQFGMPVGGNYVDLSPGMRLRVETGGYDFVAPSSAWNSFSAAGGVTSAVARSSAQDVCFDAFLAAGATSTALGSPAWVGNLADLVGLGPRRHFRLTLPRAMPGPTQISAAPAYGQTPALIGADNWTDLTSATNAYFAGGTCAPATSGRPVICSAFTGRPVVVPEILVRFLGQWLYLPVGSTVQHLLDLNHPLVRALVPQSSSFNRLALAGLDPAAVFGPTLVSIPPPTQYLIQPEGGQLSQWDLPLQPGDTLITTWSGS